MQIAIVVLFGCIACALGQQLTCTQQASFSQQMDGTFTSVTCSNGQDLGDRCSGCCQAWAMNQGISPSNSVGFINDDSSGCVCCAFGASNAIAAADTGNNFRVGRRMPAGDGQAFACQGPGCNFRQGKGTILLP